VGFAVNAAPASADHHLMKIREVFPGASNTGFIELQMTAGGQNLVNDHDVTTYGPTGLLLNTYEFPTGVGDGGDQRTILVGDSAAAGTPDFVESDLDMSASGGGACFISDEFGAIDCVTWGNFIGDLPGPTGSPASPAGVTAGKSLIRSIAQGCNLKLDDPDDSESSATDFTETDPTPRNNSVTPTETNCPTAPNTVLDTDGSPDPLPPAFTNQTTARFNFSSTGGTGPVTFECRLDTEPSFSACTGGVTKQYTDIPEGARTFSVRATASGQTDPSPATHSWTVDTTPPDTTISPTGLPTNPTASPTAAFSFTSSEPTGATFRCKLDTGAEEDCTSGKSYSNLATGSHTFTVFSTDHPGNTDDSPATYTWMVDRSPPDTNIVSGPTQPVSTVDTATFVFEEVPDEPGVTFQCRLITPTVPSPSFGACPPSYQGLGEGQHTFEVRASDALGNADPTPDSWQWEVDAVSIPPPETTITKAPKKKGTDTTPKITFTATNSPTGFQCRVDAKPYAACTSPHTTKRLKLGKHTFEVFATGPGGVEAEAAKASFKIVRKR